MGERQTDPQLSFNASLKADFQASRVTSDGGPILVGSWMSDWWRSSSSIAVAKSGAERGASEQCIGCTSFLASGPAIVRIGTVGQLDSSG
jgi:hypothetical protein